jgi:hypothetical protein
MVFVPFVLSVPLVFLVFFVIHAVAKIHVYVPPWNTPFPADLLFARFLSGTVVAEKQLARLTQIDEGIQKINDEENLVRRFRIRRCHARSRTRRYGYNGQRSAIHDYSTQG